MPIHTRFKPQFNRKPPGRWVYGVLALAILAIVTGLVWWFMRPAPSDQPTQIAPTTTNIPPATASVVTNAAPVVVPSTAAPPSVAVAPPPASGQTSPPPVSAHQTSAPPVVAVTNTVPVPPGTFPRPVRDVFEAQLALDRLGISSGSIDGIIGPQTRAALAAFQKREILPVTAELDAATKSHLLLRSSPYTNYVVSAADLARLRPLSPTWLGKSRQDKLDFETLLELLAEKSHSHPNLIRQLNPDLDWANIAAGVSVKIPAVNFPSTREKAASIRIQLGAKTLEAIGADGQLLAHFPCSIAQRVEKRPEGELRVVSVAGNPNYTFDPAVFPESAEARKMKQKLILPPGPNNPVGTAWIGLDRPGYGIHGTPQPEMVGRTESHGCFRVANWNAKLLEKLVWVGMPVHVEP
ncbi:MAG: L,D-transpeptidase family protein [Verrucomicrobiota bacterium]